MYRSIVNRSSNWPTISSVAGLKVKILSSVRSNLPLIEVPNHPMRMLRMINPATPSCKFRYCGVLWLRVLLLITMKVPQRKVEINDKK